MIKILFKTKSKILLNISFSLWLLLFNNISKIHISLNKVKFKHQLKEAILKMIFIVKIKVLNNKANHQFMEKKWEIKKSNSGDQIYINTKKIHYIMHLRFIIILFYKLFYRPLL